MAIASPSIGEEYLLEHYTASNAASRDPQAAELALERDRRWGDIASEPGGVDYIETEAAGVAAMWLVPARRVDEAVLLCLHGGGFVSGSMYSHRRMYAHIAKRTGVRARCSTTGGCRPSPPGGGAGHRGGLSLAARPGPRGDRRGR